MPASAPDHATHDAADIALVVAASPGAKARRRAVRGAWLTLALGYLPALAILAGVAVTAAARAGADPTALALAVGPAVAAAALTIAAAWRTLAALRRAAFAPVDPRAAATDALAARVEFDHRIRNTLQVATSLLSLELRRAGPSGERAALLRVQARLHSMSLVHRRSSALDAPAAVRIDLIAAEIFDHLFAGQPFAPAGSDVPLDPVSTEPEHATAFALFVNEALMGARDMADSGRAAGPASISLRDCGGGAALLTIRLAGCAAAHDVASDGDLGARLMRNCAEQLGATLSHQRNGDVSEVLLAIPPPPSG